MTNPVDTNGGAAIQGDLNTGGGDAVLGHQINLTLVGDLSGERVDAILPVLRDLLARPDTSLVTEAGAGLGHERLRLRDPQGATVLLCRQAAEALLPAAARLGDPDAYLAALLVHPRYGHWARRYVPLAGTLTEACTPAGWDGIEPELTALEAIGEGAQRQFRRVPLADIAEALARHPAWVLLGEPGSGKTTSLHRLLIDLARARLQSGAGPLPLLLSLADYRGFASPLAFAAAVWRQRVGTDDLEDRLRAGGLCLLLDALNEMPFDDAADYRARVAAWRGFVQDWPGNRLVFTCRSRDYGEPLGLPQVEIERLDDGRVQDFLGRYLEPGLAATAWQRLAGAPLLDLVRNPFYLYILCWLVAGDQAWPTGRAGLFRGFVGHLLGREQQRHHPDWPGDLALTAGLATLAEGMQRLGEGTRLPKAQVLERLPTRVETPDGPLDTDPRTLLRLGLAATLLDTDLDGDLAGGSGQQVRFYHHQLQEYFAAVALLGRLRRGEDLADRWRHPVRKAEMPDPGPMRPDEPLPPPPTTGWEEPTLMAAGLAPDPGPLIAAVRAVAPVLAARCLVEPGVAAPPGAAEPTRRALLADLVDQRVHRRARIAAGDALGRLGDPRFEACEVDGVKILLPPLVEIPAGVVTLGSSWWEVWRLGRTGLSVADERRRHRVRLPTFAIGCYPVTNAEFTCFMADGGYGDGRWWDTAQAQAWRRGELKAGFVEDMLATWRVLKADPGLMQRQGWSQLNIAHWTKALALDEAAFRAVVEQRGAERPMDRPAFWTDERFAGPSQPVVGVTWFEANAYCRWLTERWRAAGDRPGRPLPAAVQVCLPSEAQWERAARLGTSRRYPWGRGWDPDLANTAEGQVLRPTPVGAYPGGASPAGVQDLAGNTWEWCASLYRAYPISPGDGRGDPEAEGHRVVRGGSWGRATRNARCAYRGRFQPGDFDDVLGFRVVLSLADSGF